MTESVCIKRSQDYARGLKGKNELKAVRTMCIDSERAINDLYHNRIDGDQDLV